MIMQLFESSDNTEVKYILNQNLLEADKGKRLQNFQQMIA